MSKKLNSENQSQLLPFVPRSVLMALESQSTKTKEKKEEKNSKKGEKSLDGSREVLLKSIAGYLESNGFKKTLDMFLSEAQIEENSWKSSAANLDDIFSKNLESSNGNEAASIEYEKTQDTEKEILNVEKSTPVEEKSEEKESKKERKEKKKKKKSNEKASDENSDADVEKSSPEEEKTQEIKEKNDKKKKSKKQKEEINNNVEELKSSNNENKDEKKKKKKEKEIIEINQENEQQTGESKVSKKRKKPDSEENKEGENMGNDTNAPEMENGNEEFKSGKKDKASAEPKTANAFKRVKIEEVKFADQRLQDNSYWAKSGADSGYGAKAQQILEQVRGRDFRHEKTKKKRGSYRGGQIDLQSHSIKFNYSDEE